jgi:hypothetical protein
LGVKSQLAGRDFHSFAGSRGEVSQDEHAFHATKVVWRLRLKGDASGFGLKITSS